MIATVIPVVDGKLVQFTSDMISSSGVYIPIGIYFHVNVAAEAHFCGGPVKDQLNLLKQRYVG